MPSDPRTTRFFHRDLGDIAGVDRTEDVVQFRGIPFASIPGRFRQSALRTELPSQPFAATRSGPFCSQPELPTPQYWKGLVPEGYSTLPEPSSDEFNCLNLNITVPRTALTDVPASKLPVLLFIHGGAFLGGSQSIQVSGRELFDATNLVRKSILRRQALIVVTINYRVGPLGFLASHELREFNKRHNEPVGNYGLHDQRQALEWVFRFIAGFGGDYDNVTIHGTSAGASSCHYQCIFPGRRFRRAILSSGTFIGIGPLPLEEHQTRFKEYKEALLGQVRGDDVLSDTVALLQAVSVDRLTSAVQATVFNPLIEEDWIPSDLCERVRSNQDPLDIMVGACAYEEDITTLILSEPTSPITNDPTTLLDRVTSILRSNSMLPSPSALSHPAILSAYSLSPPTLPSHAQLTADLAFRLPPLYLALHSPPLSQTLVYEIQATSPFPHAPVSSYGKAHHGINDLFLFDVASDMVPLKHWRAWEGAVKQIQAVWLDFCSGRLPWEPVRRGLGGRGPIYVFGECGAGVQKETLGEAVGSRDEKRWLALLGVCR